MGGQNPGGWHQQACSPLGLSTLGVQESWPAALMVSLSLSWMMGLGTWGLSVCTTAAWWAPVGPWGHPPVPAARTSISVMSRPELLSPEPLPCSHCGASWRQSWPRVHMPSSWTAPQAHRPVPPEGQTIYAPGVAGWGFLVTSLTTPHLTSLTSQHHRMPQHSMPPASPSSCPVLPPSPVTLQGPPGLPRAGRATPAAGGSGSVWTVCIRSPHSFKLDGGQPWSAHGGCVPVQLKYLHCVQTVPGTPGKPRIGCINTGPLGSICHYPR